MTRDLYFERHLAEYGRVARAPSRFIDGPRTGDLVWARSLSGVYYLARITGEWRYEDDAEARAADMVNVYPAEFVEVGTSEAVPGSVLAAFRPPVAFQAINDTTAARYSEHLFKSLGGSGPTEGGPAEPLAGDLFIVLSDRDLEDLVLVYLQRQGWVFLPHTRARDTVHYEFVVAEGRTGKRAVVQVKSGGTVLPARDYAGSVPAILFAAGGHYGGDLPANVITIPRDALDAFVENEPQFLPEAVRHWRALIDTQKLASSEQLDSEA